MAYYTITAYLKDDKDNVFQAIVKDNLDVDESTDSDVFYYFNGESEIKEFMSEDGTPGFVILEYEKIEEPMKILILGHAEHGKDCLAKIVAKYLDLTVVSATYIAGRNIVFPSIKDLYGYKTVQECINDRRNHRKEWHDLIKEYNTPDLTKHVENVLTESDIYIGLRDLEELEACKDKSIFDVTIGIFDPTKPLEPKSSMSIDIFKESDFIIYAKESEELLERSVFRILSNFSRL